MSDSDLTKRHALPGVMEEELELATKDESMGLLGEALLLLGEIEHEKMIYESEEKENKHFELSPSYEQRFFSFLHQINLRLMEDKDNFYGYFFIQMDKAIRVDLKSPSGVNFKNGKYVMYFNPFIFLNLTISQMESDIRHEILHIVSMYLERSKILRKEYSKLATNLAMDVVVNNYLSPLPPDAVTLAVLMQIMAFICFPLRRSNTMWLKLKRLCAWKQKRRSTNRARSTMKYGKGQKKLVSLLTLKVRTIFGMNRMRWMKRPYKSLRKAM